MEFTQRTVLGNTGLQWLTALAVLVTVMAAVWLVRMVAVRHLRKLAERTRNKVDDLAVDLLENTKAILVFFAALYFGTLPLTLPEEVSLLLRTMAIIAVLGQAAFWGNQLIAFVLRRVVKERADDPISGTATYTALSFILRLALWSLVVVLALDNIPGVQVTSLITGLGIGGIAIALAVQNILGDLFASLSIVLDKPFVIGDFVVVDDLSGTVEHIGLKTTRVRSLGGEELVFSNNDLLSSRIRNFKRMMERRAVFTLGVAYETPYEKLVAIPQILQTAIEEQELARFDRAHFQSYGDSSLIFEVAYYVLVPNYGPYMDVLQAINLEIFRRFAEEEIAFAYPTRRLLMERVKARADGDPQ